MDDFVIRSAVPSDAPGVLDFWAVAGENDARPADRADLVLRLIARDPDALILATDADARLVGTIVAGWDGWRANLYRLAVHPDVRGRGLARHLLEVAERRLTTLGGERACAMVLDDNETGQPCGARPATRRRTSGPAGSSRWGTGPGRARRRRSP